MDSITPGVPRCKPRGHLAFLARGCLKGDGLAGGGGLLCRLTHAHCPDAVFEANFDTAVAAHHIKETLVLVEG